MPKAPKKGTFVLNKRGIFTWSARGNVARGVLRGLCGQNGGGGRDSGGRYRLTGYQLQVICAGVLFGAALGVMDKTPALLRRGFNRMA